MKAVGRTIPLPMRRAATLILLAAAASPAIAQNVTAPSPAPKRVQAGTKDRDPLTTSLEQIPPDFRHDDAFQGLYELLGGSSKTGRFMRTAGGLHAVFPRSEFVPTMSGDLPVVPAGTVFYIGPPPGDDRPATNVQSVSVDNRIYEAMRIDNAIDPDARPRFVRSVSRTERPIGEGVTDEHYREALLRRISDRERRRLESPAVSDALIADPVEPSVPGPRTDSTRTN